MNSRKVLSGFTIVELLIVILVIAILAAVTIVAFNGITARGNDTERQSDINTVKKQLAQFRIINSHYPRYDDMASNTLVWIRANMPEMPDSALVAPGGTDANSFASSTAPAINAYSYRPYFDNSSAVQTVCTQANLTADSKTPSDCDRYEIRWRSQADNSIKLSRSLWGW